MSEKLIAKFIIWLFCIAVFMLVALITSGTAYFLLACIIITLIGSFLIYRNYSEYDIKLVINFGISIGLLVGYFIFASEIKSYLGPVYHSNVLKFLVAGVALYIFYKEFTNASYWNKEGLCQAGTCIPWEEIERIEADEKAAQIITGNGSSVQMKVTTIQLMYTSLLTKLYMLNDIKIEPDGRMILSRLADKEGFRLEFISGQPSWLESVVRLTISSTFVWGSVWLISILVPKTTVVSLFSIIFISVLLLVAIFSAIFAIEAGLRLGNYYSNLYDDRKGSQRVLLLDKNGFLWQRGSTSESYAWEDFEYVMVLNKTAIIKIKGEQPSYWYIEISVTKRMLDKVLDNYIFSNRIKFWPIARYSRSSIFG